MVGVPGPGGCQRSAAIATSPPRTARENRPTDPDGPERTGDHPPERNVRYFMEPGQHGSPPDWCVATYPTTIRPFDGSSAMVGFDVVTGTPPSTWSRVSRVRVQLPDALVRYQIPLSPRAATCSCPCSSTASAGCE